MIFVTKDKTSVFINGGDCGLEIKASPEGYSESGVYAEFSIFRKNSNYSRKEDFRVKLSVAESEELLSWLDEKEAEAVKCTEIPSSLTLTEIFSDGAFQTKRASFPVILDSRTEHRSLNINGKTKLPEITVGRESFVLFCEHVKNGIEVALERPTLEDLLDEGGDENAAN